MLAYYQRTHRALATTAWLCLGPLATGEVERLLLPVSPAIVAMLPIGVVLLAAWVLLYEFQSAAPSAETSVFDPRRRAA
jgi:hypothetical protein